MWLMIVALLFRPKPLAAYYYYEAIEKRLGGQARRDERSAV
ncbi:hypothetical protein N5A92_22980 [Chelativorans sp. EGI FJ00035]|uniref:Uncharacterized protein n=1 Tax=Chelativorans salis TaxID=2978478 RepID=A0ABT2LTR4_9HYPH|nr:hypothetical protein [Chelativorans sp. EGI FJ00035]MCT7377889.1 hypothetical protein [Chelativorans sp. EGI FJ00035]